MIACERRALLALSAALFLCGCKTIPELAGIASGAAAGGGTGSPAIGFAVGVGVATATSAAVRWYGRSRAHAEQQAIADAASNLSPGGRASWQINHIVPIGDEHGELFVVGAIPNPLGLCKRIVFSVNSGTGAHTTRDWFTTDLCRTEGVWRWANAEPAVLRWGYLQ